MQKHFTKESIKTALNRMLFYILSSLSTFGIYLVIFFPIVSLGFIEKANNAIGYNVVNLIVNAAISIGSAFTFLFVFFLQDHEYKSFFISKDKENLTPKQTFIAHIKQFGIFDLVWFAIITLIFTIMCSIPGGLNSFLAFGFASATFFIMVIPLPFLIIPMWILFSAGTYLGSIYFAHKIWHAKRRKLLKSMTTNDNS